MENVEKLRIRPSPGGAVLAVKAAAGASRDRLVGVLGDCLKIATAAPPEKGRANAAIAEILAASLGVERRSVALIAGPANPRKEFRIAGLSAEKLRAILRKV